MKERGLFCYNDRWGTLIGYPASYGSDTELNDHHFHYGYFVKAAAELARLDPDWARDEKLRTITGRRARQDEIDLQLTEWTRDRDDHDGGYRALGVEAP